jgi:hypothetical protein
VRGRRAGGSIFVSINILRLDFDSLRVALD